MALDVVDRIEDDHAVLERHGEGLVTIFRAITYQGPRKILSVTSFLVFDFSIAINSLPLLPLQVFVPVQQRFVFFRHLRHWNFVKGHLVICQLDHDVDEPVCRPSLDSPNAYGPLCSLFALEQT